MAEDPVSHPPTPAVRAAFIAIAAFAGGAGALPYLLFIDRPAWLLAVVPAAAVIAFVALWKIETGATTHPSWGEWLLGAWSAVAQPSTGSLVALVFYGLGYYGAKLFTLLGGLLGFAPHNDPSTWGFWASVWVMSLMVIVGASDGIQTLFRQLYPREPWARSAFQSFLAQTELLVFVVAGAILVLAFVLAAVDRESVAMPVILSLVFFYTSFPLAEAGEEAADKSQVKIVEAFAALLQEAGYRIVRTPRTGKAEIDPLLTPVDLLARGDDRAFALQVKSVASRTALEWTEANALRTAALVLSDEVLTDGGAPMPVEPVLIAVGGTVAQSLTAFSQRERVAVVHFEDAGATSDRAAVVRRLQEAGLVFGRAPVAPAVPPAPTAPAVPA